ncbi:hypothetical protein J8273_0461 [Carpediemonas membranifera]|uniref:Uncharacterized protein n=1 Tax=Carpediemonas membranifera TaxID=201153 RepID=A0A8J6BZ69_9EUKA|nr:hypothetical protein J8273_0461 [Carpediemonas membranifera]|eukprot:KAG9395241.1 hypothetical protein J8273_0461 [Carpediemonas membranifera]
MPRDGSGSLNRKRDQQESTCWPVVFEILLLAMPYGQQGCMCLFYEKTRPQLHSHQRLTTNGPTRDLFKVWRSHFNGDGTITNYARRTAVPLYIAQRVAIAMMTVAQCHPHVRGRPTRGGSRRLAQPKVVVKVGGRVLMELCGLVLAWLSSVGPLGFILAAVSNVTLQIVSRAATETLNAASVAITIALGVVSSVAWLAVSLFVPEIWTAAVIAIAVGLATQTVVAKLRQV